MTDWNAESELLKGYIAYRVDHWQPRITIDLSMVKCLNPEALFAIFQQTGVLYVSNMDEYEGVLSFEEWRERMPRIESKPEHGMIFNPIV